MMKQLTVVIGLVSALAPAIADEKHPYLGYPYNRFARDRLEQLAIKGDDSWRATLVSEVYTYASSCTPIGADLHDALKVLTTFFVTDRDLIEANKRTDEAIGKAGRNEWCAKQATFIEHYLYQDKRDTE